MGHPILGLLSLPYFPLEAILSQLDGLASAVPLSDVNFPSSGEISGGPDMLYLLCSAISAPLVSIPFSARPLPTNLARMSPWNVI